MKRNLHLGTIAAAMLLLAAVAGAQSLGDVARQTRKQNAKKTPVKVFTNDNLPVAAHISVTGQAPATADDNAKAADEGDNAATGDQSAKTGQADADKQKTDEDKKTYTQKRDEAMQGWKKRFADQKQQIALLEREINVMQGEYRLRAAAYYADAGNALRNQADWAKQDREYRAKLDSKQKQLEEAKQKLEDMQEEARKAGMPGSVAE